MGCLLQTIEGEDLDDYEDITQPDPVELTNEVPGALDSQAKSQTASRASEETSSTVQSSSTKVSFLPPAQTHKFADSCFQISNHIAYRKPRFWTFQHACLCWFCRQRGCCQKT